MAKVKILFLLTFACLLHLNASEESKTKVLQKPNIILILTDDQGWGGTSVQMDKNVPYSKSDFIQTPNLEKLAESGMIFSNGYAPHPNCSPSRYSILTGISPAKLKATDIAQRFSGRSPYYKGNLLNPPTGKCGIKAEDITIAQWIKKHHSEYKTAHLGKWHLEGHGPEDVGFDKSDGKTGNKEGNANKQLDPKRCFSLAKNANSWISKQVSEGHPFYLQISHYSPHLKIEYLASTKKKYSKLPQGARHNNIGYAAMSEDLDTSLGMVLDKLDSLDIRKNTYIIYLADNGAYPLPTPANTNGPLHGWKATLWEGGIRVPFIVSGPGIKGKQQCDASVVGYDLFPTISKWLNIDKFPDGIEGGSLVEALQNPDMKTIKRNKDFLVFHWPHY